MIRFNHINFESDVLLSVKTCTVSAKLRIFASNRYIHNIFIKNPLEILYFHVELTTLLGNIYGAVGV